MYLLDKSLNNKDKNSDIKEYICKELKSEQFPDFIDPIKFKNNNIQDELLEKLHKNQLALEDTFYSVYKN